MIFLYLLLIPVICIIIKLILCFIVKKFGKFSYKGINIAGFKYHSKKDIFYASKNAWQKNFGYTHMYDVACPLFRMILDTLPIRFYYDHRNWLICFWKGQYGICTGAEVGIYATKEERVRKNTLYMPVSNKDMLDISFILYKKDKLIAKVKSKHWWLAVFKLGMFSKPKELSMDIKIKFPNKSMLHAFLVSFKKLGYKKHDYQVIDNVFCFHYKRSKAKKVWTRMFILDKIRLYFNKKNAELYNIFFADLIDSNDEDKVILLKDFVPHFLKENDTKKDKNVLLLNTVVKNDSK